MNIRRIAMIGCGSMGGGMALLFAEKGISVSLQDPSEQAMDDILSKAKEAGLQDKITKHKDYDSLCKSLDETKVFVWSLPHGGVGDKVLDTLTPYLRKGDIIIDCGNEHWENTQRRQGHAVTRGVRYVGCGVSGGYQAARRGPSMCPGADDETMDLVLPTLRKVAAKDADGTPCVARIGTGGAGHYCKMIHNGIEHGMMSAIAEAYGIMRDGLRMTLDDIGDEFQRWNSSGELKNTFLIKISIDICRAVDPESKVRVVDTVEDKVVQDFTGEEGTGIWSNTEAVEQHVPAPTLSTAHFFRLASGDRNQRTMVQKAFSSTPLPPQKIDVPDRAAFLENLRLAVFTASLAAFAQGMNIIDKADRRKHFNIDYTALLQIWRAGCIIQADYIVTELLAPIYARKHAASSSDTLRDAPETNPLYEPEIAEAFKRGLPSLKQVVARGVESDAVIPALSASLEYLKMQTSTALPTSFYEAQLDYFGAHMYDKKGEDKEGKPTEGKHHFEWKPA